MTPSLNLNVLINNRGTAPATALSPAPTPTPTLGSRVFGLYNSRLFRGVQLQQSAVSSLQVANDSDASADNMVDNMDFGQLCNDFECISSPSVESTARQLVRDILEPDRPLSVAVFAISVNYKDPVRSFTGRDKYKRPLWATNALHNPTVNVVQMEMQSTSVLNIKWILKGKPKSPVGGELIIKVDSTFTLNQISGQVTEHQEVWDLSHSSLLAQTYFWSSRRLFATFEAGKDVSDSIKDWVSRPNNNIEIYPDPTGDPTKFFQRDDSFQRDFYQIALFLAIVYFVVQYLRTTL